MTSTRSACRPGRRRAGRSGPRCRAGRHRAPRRPPRHGGAPRPTRAVGAAAPLCVPSCRQRLRSPTAGESMFRIGEFARFTRVSVKMLRHYDEVGLFQPAQVDPDTGYRYYTVDQLPRLNRIILLRDLGFGLDQIADVLVAE